MIEKIIADKLEKKLAEKGGLPHMYRLSLEDSFIGCSSGNEVLDDPPSKVHHI